MGQNQTYADELRIITLTPDVSTYNTIDALIIAASVDLVKGAGYKKVRRFSRHCHPSLGYRLRTQGKEGYTWIQTETCVIGDW